MCFIFNNVRNVNILVWFDTSPAMNDPRAQPFFTNGFFYMMADGSHFCTERLVENVAVGIVYAKCWSRIRNTRP